MPLIRDLTRFKSADGNFGSKLLPKQQTASSPGEGTSCAEGLLAPHSPSCNIEDLSTTVEVSVELCVSFEDVDTEGLSLDVSDVLCVVSSTVDIEDSSTTVDVSVELCVLFDTEGLSLDDRVVLCVLSVTVDTEGLSLDDRVVLCNLPPSVDTEDLSTSKETESRACVVTAFPGVNSGGLSAT